jgi:hypothetical protein
LLYYYYCSIEIDEESIVKTSSSEDRDVALQPNAALLKEYLTTGKSRNGQIEGDKRKTSQKRKEFRSYIRPYAGRYKITLSRTHANTPTST